MPDCVFRVLLRPLVVSLIAIDCVAASPDAHSTVTAPAEKTEKATGKKPRATLQKGMTAGEVRKLWGKPEQVKTIEVNGEKVDLWVYRQSVNGPVRDVVDGQQEVTVTDPFTGTVRIVREPVYRQEFTVVKVTIVLQMIAGKLVGWEQAKKDERSVN